MSSTIGTVGRHLAAAHTKSTRALPSYKRTEKTVIVGGGQLCIPTMLKSLELGNEVVVCSSSSKFLKEATQKAGFSEKQVRFIPTTYEQGADPAYWEKVAKEVSQDTDAIRVVNTRGVSTLSPGQTYHQTIREPAESLLSGFRKGTSSKMRRAFVNCSSSTASIDGFADKHLYARSRSETDEALKSQAEDSGITGYNLRFDLVKSSRAVTTMTNPNHGVSPVEMTHAPFQMIIGDERLLTVQPVSEDQAAKAIMSPTIYDRGSFSTIDAVGPQAYSQIELYEFYATLYDKTLRIIRIPFTVAEWAAKHIPMAQLTYGIDLLKHRSEHAPANQPLDHAEFEELVEEPVLNIDGIYRSFGGPVAGIQSPTRMLVKKTATKLVECSEARKDFVRSVIPHVPNMTMQAAQTVLTARKLT